MIASTVTCRRTGGIFWAAAALSIVLAGCGGQSEKGQILARVNSAEISVHQFNFALQQSPGKTADATERDALIDKMIDRQLAIQGALDKGLDRRAEVMMRVEEAKRDILAVAYADEIASGGQSPTEDAAARYYAEHPGLFAERKVYRLREIALPSDSPSLAEAKARVERKENLTDLATWLKQQKSSFNDQLVLRPAEQLPIEAVDQLRRLKRGEALAIRFPRALFIYEVQSTEAAPLAWKDVAPTIMAHLKKQQDLALFREELKRMRSAAKISRSALIS